MEVAYTKSDILLLAVLGACSGWRGARLTTIIYYSDYLNRDVFTPPELRRGMAKLVAAGYVSDKHDRFALTRAGRKVVAWRGSKGSIPNFVDAIRRIETKLLGKEAPEMDPWLEDPSWAYPKFTDETVALAAERYSKNIAGFIRERAPHARV